MFDLKRFRKEQKITQLDMAENMGYSRSTLSNFESERQPITDSFLDKLNEVYGIDVEEFKSYNKKTMKNKPDENQKDVEYWKTKYYDLMEEHLIVMKELKKIEDNQKSKVELPH